MKYYKMYAESLKGEVGEFYCEVDSGLLMRQIYHIGENIFWADEESEARGDYLLGDQRDFDESEIDCEEISKDEFVRLWELGKKKSNEDN